MTPWNPDSWMDVAALVILALITTGGATLTTVIARRHGKTLGSIENQVTNAHETNLRDDIDKLGRMVTEGFAETRKDIHGLREEMRTERIERIEGDRRGMRQLGLLDDDG
ncbi:MAG: DUF2746 domain-containing protein [Mycobacterium sp.]